MNFTHFSRFYKTREILFPPKKGAKFEFQNKTKILKKYLLQDKTYLMITDSPWTVSNPNALNCDVQYKN